MGSSPMSVPEATVQENGKLGTALCLRIPAHEFTYMCTGVLLNPAKRGSVCILPSAGPSCVAEKLINLPRGAGDGPVS